MSSLLVTQQYFGSLEKTVSAVSICPSKILVIGRRPTYKIVPGLQIWSLRSRTSFYRLSFERDAERSVEGLQRYKSALQTVHHSSVSKANFEAAMSFQTQNDQDNAELLLRELFAKYVQTNSQALRNQKKTCFHDATT
jgi:hypothetical protein